MLLAFLYAVVCGLLRLLLARGTRLAASEIELLALRHERRVLQRRTGVAAWRPADRLLLTALSRSLPPDSWHVLPVHPATLRRWQREVSQRRWGHRARRPGRPPLAADLQALIVRLARENPRWGYVRIQGELLQLGHGIPPAPQRAGLTWPGLLRAQAAGVLASGPTIGRALGTGLLAVWLRRAVLMGKLPPSARGGGWHRAVARSWPRSQPHGTRSTATSGPPAARLRPQSEANGGPVGPGGPPPFAARASRLWVPAAGGQRVPAEAERRTDAPSWEGAARPWAGEGRRILRHGRPVAAHCWGRGPPHPATGRRVNARPAAALRSASLPHARRPGRADTARLRAA
jgi:hypothetical protein